MDVADKPTKIKRARVGLFLFMMATLPLYRYIRHNRISVIDLGGYYVVCPVVGKGTTSVSISVLISHSGLQKFRVQTQGISDDPVSIF